MNTTDDENVGIPVDDALERPIRWVRWVVIGIAVFLVVALFAGWLLRKTIAERAFQGWCVERQLTCEGKIVRLGADGATIQGLKVSSGTNVPFEATELSAHLKWPRLFTPRLAGINVDKPILRGTLDERGVRLYGLEKLGGKSEGSGALSLPAIEVSDGRAFFATDAGELSATVAVHGTFPKKGTLDLVIDPAALKGPDTEFSWSESVVSLAANNGRIEGNAEVNLQRASLKGIEISDAVFAAKIDAADAGDGPMKLSWTGAIEAGKFPGGEVNKARTTGDASFVEIPDLSSKAVMAALTTAMVHLESGKVFRGEYGADAVELDADLKGDAGNIGGPVELNLTNARAQPGGAAIASMRGNFSRSAEGTLLYSGRASASDAHISPGVRKSVSAAFSFPGAFADHQNGLRSATERALAKFSTDVNLSIGRRDAITSLSAREETVLRAASGLVLKIDPPADGTWISIRGGDRTVNGAISLSGGGAPDLQIDLDEFRQDASGLAIRSQAFKLKPWTAGGKTLSADLDSFSLTRNTDTFDLVSQGRLSVSGPMSGITLKPTTIVGGIRVSREGEGWQVRPHNGRCLSISNQGFTFGSIQAAPVRLDACPKGEGFLRAGKGSPSGTVLLGAVSLPFEAGTTSGTLKLAKTSVDWSSKGGFAMTVIADHLDLPLTIGKRTLAISGDLPRMGIATGKSSPKLTARLGATTFSGTLIPARVSADSFAFDGVSAKGGVSGDLSANTVLIQDYRDDPIYQPLISDIKGTLTKGQLEMIGPLRLKADGTTVADTLVNLDVIKLTGKASVVSRPLHFQPGALQPHMLSERLRGAFTYASGDMSAKADVDITSGKLAGTADIKVERFGFQTTRLGRVKNVNGDVHFSDLLGLTTSRNQVATIGAMNVGVPLKDGRIAFHLDKGTDIGIESASFPFAGGHIALAPLVWRLGGDDQRVEVSAKQIDLGQLVSVLKLPDTQAVGTVSGTFPVDFVGSAIQVRDARLAADAKGGRIAYTGGAVDSASASDPNAKLAFEALQDLQFSVLEIGLNGDLNGRTIASLHLLGRNTKPLAFGKNLTMPKGQAFEFNLTLDSQLKELVNSAKFATQQDKFIDIVVDLSKKNAEKKTGDE